MDPPLPQEGAPVAHGQELSYSPCHPGGRRLSAALAPGVRPSPPWGPPASHPVFTAGPLLLSALFPGAGKPGPPLCRPLSQRPSWQSVLQTHGVYSAHYQDKDVLAKGTSDNGICGWLNPWKGSGRTPGLGGEHAGQSGRATAQPYRQPAGLCCLLAMSAFPCVTPQGSMGRQANRSSPEEVPVAGSGPRHSLGVSHVSYSVR